MAAHVRRALPGGSSAPSEGIVSADGIDRFKIHRLAPKSQENVIAEFNHTLIPIGPIVGRIVQRLALAREVRDAS